MTKNEIIEQLNNTSALRENRLRVANLIMQDRERFDILLKIIFDIDTKISIKAAWVFEFVCKKKIHWLYDNLDYFTQNIQKLHFDSAVRSIAKVCQILVLKSQKTTIVNFTNQHKESIAEVGFDWMISRHKVAIKAYTMQTLFYLGKQFDWIHGALQAIIIDNMDKETAAYKSRGLITLAQIKKFTSR